MNKRILIIEDDLFVRDLYMRILQKQGYEVDGAADGMQGIEMARQRQYDLVLLDIMLPKKTGLEVLKEMRQTGTKTQKVPVYLLTNLGQESIIKEAFKLGADGYLLKARFLPKQVVEEIDSFFKAQKSPVNSLEDSE